MGKQSRTNQMLWVHWPHSQTRPETPPCPRSRRRTAPPPPLPPPSRPSRHVPHPPPNPNPAPLPYPRPPSPPTLGRSRTTALKTSHARRTHAVVLHLERRVHAVGYPRRCDETIYLLGSRRAPGKQASARMACTEPYLPPTRVNSLIKSVFWHRAIRGRMAEFCAPKTITVSMPGGHARRFCGDASVHDMSVTLWRKHSPPNNMARHRTLRRAMGGVGVSKDAA